MNNLKFKNMGCRVYTGFLRADLAWSWLQKMETIVITFKYQAHEAFMCGAIWRNQCGLARMSYYGSEV